MTLSPIASNGLVWSQALYLEQHYLGNVKLTWWYRYSCTDALFLQGSPSQHVSSSPVQVICAFWPSLGKHSFMGCEIQPFLLVPPETFPDFLNPPVLNFWSVTDQTLTLLFFHSHGSINSDLMVWWCPPFWGAARSPAEVILQLAVYFQEPRGKIAHCNITRWWGW